VKATEDRVRGAEDIEGEIEVVVSKRDLGVIKRRILCAAKHWEGVSRGHLAAGMRTVRMTAC
jgi:hypothetical protein